MKGIETGGGKGKPAPRKLKKKPQGIVPTVEKFAADTLKQARSKPSRASQVKDVKSNADRRRAEPAVRRELERIKTKQSQVKDTKGASARLPEKERQKVVNSALVKLASHTAHHAYEYKNAPVTKNLTKLGLLDNMKGYPARSQALRASTTGAPVLKILDQTTRPLHAIAGATDAAIKGKNVGRAAKRGIQNKDKTTFSKVLKDAGAPKVVQGVGGFALDVAADPLTYATFGTASVAKKAALDVAKKTEARALKAGMSEAGAKTVAKAAAKKAEAAAKPGKGVTASIAGHRAPGVTEATAAVGRGVKKVAAKSPKVVKRVGAGSKNVARDVRPTLAPAGIKQEEFRVVHDAAASTRGQIAAGQAHAQSFARAVQKHVPEKTDQALVVHAIEKRQIGKLPERLRKPAIAVRSELRHQRRSAVRSGLAVKSVEKGAAKGEAKGYFPHAVDERLRAGEGIVDEAPVKVEGVARRTPKAQSMNKRSDRRPIEAINAETPGKMSTDVPLVMANHISNLSTAAARAKFNRVLADAGRPVKFGDAPKAGEAVYAIKGANISEVKPGHSEVKGGRYVAINRKLAESELAATSPIREATTIGHAFNQTNSGFKRLATFTPGFHVRNAIGDTQMAYLSQPGHRLVLNTVQGARLLKEQRRQAKAVKRLEPVEASGKTMKVAGQRVPVEDVLKGAKDNAAAQTGYVGRELNDLVGRSADGSVKKVRRGSGRITGVMQDRENLMRLATYKHGLDTGKTSAKAGRLSRATHIDYGDLTTFERQARRVMPFYTFSARSIPLHAQKILTNPGKFANYQKIREEAANLLGLPVGYESGESKYQKQQAGVPLKIGGHNFTVSAGLPLTSLNQLPVGAPVEVLASSADFFAAMVTPVIKDPVEFGLNRSFFSHSDVQSRNAPRVAAPVWVEAIYNKDKGLAKTLGITPEYVDKKTGEKTWGWYGKSDYIAKILPGPFNILKQLSTPGSNRAGQGTGSKVLAAATGIKPSLIDPGSTKITELYRQDDKLMRDLAGMRQQGISAKKPTAEYRKKLAQEKAVAAEINRLSTARGDKIPLKKTAGRKPNGDPTLGDLPSLPELPDLPDLPPID